MNANTEKWNYTELSEYFEEIETPEEIVPALEEMRAAYLELNLFAEQTMAGVERIARQSHDEALNHSLLLKDLIRIFKTIQTTDEKTKEGQTEKELLEEINRNKDQIIALNDEIILLQIENNKLKNA